MEYLKKEDLIKGEIYKSHYEGQGDYIFIKKENLKNNTFINVNRFCKLSGDFRNENGFYEYLLATSEEKHWLLECIKLDKFIEFEEAMKTFIPEYYQYIGEIDSYKSSFIKGKTYKIINKNDLEASFNFIDEKGTPNGYEGVNWKKFKPSTKEAYDAQFVVKESEFVLPEKWYTKITSENKDIINHWRRNIIQYNNSDCQYETISQDGSGSSLNFINEYKSYQEITFEQFKKYVLKEETAIEFGNKVDKEIVKENVILKPIIKNKTELEIWLENTKSLNLSLEDLEKYIGSGQTCNFDNIYMKLEGHYSKGRAKILFDKWNEKVIEPLPQFKVIESIETITKVENNEGNQFFIGDIVKSESGNIQTIQSFKYNEDKTEIFAVTSIDNEVGIFRVNINKIEHYIEPKNEK